ncbi:MAG: ABC transporter transmembrane domain-containing protein [Amphritea sp.]
MSTSSHKTTLHLLLEFSRPYKRTLFLAVLALVFTAGITLSIGQGVRLLIDGGFVEQSPDQLNKAILIILLLTLLMAGGTFARFYLVSWLGERVSADIRQSVFDHLVRLHPSYFETNLSGEIMSRLTTDTTLLQTIIGSSFSMALRSTLMFIGTLVMLLLTDVKLTGVVFLCVPFILLPIIFYGRKVRALSRKTQDSVANVGSYAGEVIQQLKTVQSYTREAQEQKAFSLEVEQAFEVGKQRIRQRSILIAAVITLVFGAVGGMLWIGGQDVLSGAMTAGDLGAFLFYAILLSSSVATISEVWGDLQRAAGAGDRLMELLQVQSEILPPQTLAVDPAQLDASITFEQVSFHYPSRPDQAALENFSLVIEPGQSLALVGPSGAGKSTIFELLQRFYDPQQGSVLLGDSDIRNFDPGELRQQMALVPQQPVLFSADVWHNIRYGKPDASDEEVIAAAKAANADGFIQHLPEGYDSYLGEKGVRLSGGQKQRIAIARAILKDPRILLLDEATSALDAESEHQVQEALNRLMQGRTTIIIAHRLATILHADKTVVLEQGKLIATGRHADLIESCELYARLAELQFNEANLAASGE